MFRRPSKPRKGFALLALPALFGAALILGGTGADGAVLGSPSSVAARTGGASSQRQGPFAILLVVDAARFDQVNLDKMPNLAALVSNGTQYSRAWVGELPSLTETSHATMGTGVFPYRHLVLGETWRVPGKDQMSPNLLNGPLVRTGYIGNFIRQKNVSSVAASVHKKYPGSKVVALGAHKIYAADSLGAGTADYVAFGGLDKRRHFVPSAIPGHAPARSILASKQLDLPSYPRVPGTEDAWATTLAEKFLFKYHPRLIMVNWPEVDVVGHTSGTGAAVMQPYMANIDAQIGRLVAAYGRAGILSQTYFVITADHAMVPSIHTVESTVLEKVIARAGGKPLYVGHGDYSPIWMKNLDAVPRVAAALARARLPNVAAVYVKNIGGKYSLLSDPARLATPLLNQSYGDLLNTFTSPESPDIVLVYDEDTTTMTPFLRKIGRKGDHGGATWGAQHIPLILAGPGIKHGYTSAYPARLLDIAPTVETLLGIQPQHVDGVPLADSMVRPPSWAVTAQSRRAGRLSEDVTGLERGARG